MAEFAKTALKRAFWKAKGKKISLTGITELPDEVVLQIAEYVLHDYSTSGYIARPATVEHHKPPEADKPYRRQSSRRTGNTLLTACALCTLLEKATEALWETLKSPRRAFRLMFPKKVLPNLSFLVVNRRLNRVGRDVLFRLNTFTLTSTETKLLLERPGTERLFRDLNVYERDPSESIFIDLHPIDSADFLKKLLKAPYLRHLSIDIEPFFLYFPGLGPHKAHFNANGLYLALSTFNLFDLLEWRCTGLGTYTLHPTPFLLLSRTNNIPRRRNPWLLPIHAKKLTFTLPLLSRTWTRVLALSPRTLRYLAHSYLDTHQLKLRLPLHKRYFDWMVRLRQELHVMEGQPLLREAVQAAIERWAEDVGWWEGAVERMEGVKGVIPGECGSRGDHFWTVVCGEMLGVARAGLGRREVGVTQRVPL